jgi:ATP adenylyltransferase/5',5'''-P-1,P-4-tetraphosphate phosphorylase II
MALVTQTYETMAPTQKAALRSNWASAGHSFTHKELKRTRKALLVFHNQICSGARFVRSVGSNPFSHHNWVPAPVQFTKFWISLIPDTF